MMSSVRWVFFAMLLTAHAVCWGFEATRESARAASMGGALMGGNGSSMAVFALPTGLSGIYTSEVCFLGDAPYVGLPGISMGAGAVSAAVPCGFGGIGIGYTQFEINGLLREQMAVLGWGVPITGLPLEMRAGVAVKYLNRGYLIAGDALAARDPVFDNGTSKAGVTADAGIQCTAGRVQAGVVVRNSTEPDLGLNTEDRVPREVHGGVLYYLAGIGVSVAADVLFKDVPEGSRESGVQFSGGLEKWLGKSSVAVRCGMREHEITAGMGFRWHQVIIDYATVFNMNLSQDTAGTHIMSVTCRFGRPRKRHGIDGKTGAKSYRPTQTNNVRKHGVSKKAVVK